MPSSRTPHLPRRGVTLLELLVVLVLMALAAAVVIPTLRRPPPDARADGIDAVIARARRAASRRGESLRLRVDRDGQWALVAARTGDLVDRGRLDAVQGDRVVHSDRQPISLDVDVLGNCAPLATGSDGTLDPLRCTMAPSGQAP